mmetsp:Transcript_108285/g.306191  ORF Transcript_108285/g.306191 Transcript_108285/m.306191 type:complete len:355 (+) Transcript_108285:1887-2951(+)
MMEIVASNVSSPLEYESSSSLFKCPSPSLSYLLKVAALFSRILMALAFLSVASLRAASELMLSAVAAIDSWIRICMGRSCCLFSLAMDCGSSILLRLATRKAVQALHAVLASSWDFSISGQDVALSSHVLLVSSRAALAACLNLSADDSAAPASSASSFSSFAASSSCSFLRLSSSSFCLTAASIRALVCSTAWSASSWILLCCAPQLATSRCKIWSSSTFTESYSSCCCAWRMRWTTFRITRMAACSIRRWSSSCCFLMASSRRFRSSSRLLCCISSSCRRCSASRRRASSCWRRRLSSARRLASASIIWRCRSSSCRRRSASCRCRSASCCCWRRCFSISSACWLPHATSAS